jgi:hypothetical protein
MLTAASLRRAGEPGFWLARIPVVISITSQTHLCSLAGLRLAKSSEERFADVFAVRSRCAGA